MEVEKAKVLIGGRQETMTGIGELIAALSIIRKYIDEGYHIQCEHDVMIVYNIDEKVVSEDDKKRLEELGFTFLKEFGALGSFRYGSC